MSSPNVLYGLTFSTKRSMDRYNLKFSNKIDSLERKNAKDGYNTRKCVYENYDKLFLKKTTVVNGYNTRKEIYSEYENYFLEEGNMVLYYDNENGTVKHSQKKLRQKNISLLDEIQKKNKSCLYQNYISFENEYTQKNIAKKYSVDELYKKISPHIDEYLLKNNFNLNNIKYFITFHTNTKNFHFHIDFIEKEPTREKNKLDKKYFKDLRKKIMLDLDKDLAKEYYKHNEDKLNLKNEIREQMKSINFNKLDNLFKIGNQYYQEEKVRYYKDIKHKKFKNIIEEIKKESIRLNPQFQEQYKKFEESLKKDTKYYSKLYGAAKDKSHINKQIEEIDLRLNNLILKQIKSYQTNTKDNMLENQKLESVKSENLEFTYETKEEFQEPLKTENYKGIRNNNINNQTEELDKEYKIARNLKNNIYNNSKRDTKTRKLNELLITYKHSKYQNQIKYIKDIERTLELKNRITEIEEEQINFKETLEQEVEENHKKNKDYIFKKKEINEAINNKKINEEMIETLIKDKSSSLSDLIIKENIAYNKKNNIQKNIAKEIRNIIKHNYNAKELYENGYLVKKTINNINYKLNIREYNIKQLLEENEKYKKCLDKQYESNVKKKVNFNNELLELIVKKDQETLDEKATNILQKRNSLLNSSADLTLIEKNKLKQLENDLSKIRKISNSIKQNQNIISKAKIDMRKNHFENNIDKFFEEVGINISDDKVSRLKEIYSHQKNSFYISARGNIKMFSEEKNLNLILEEYQKYITNNSVRKYNKTKIRKYVYQLDEFSKLDEKIKNNLNIKKFSHSGFVFQSGEFKTIENQKQDILKNIESEKDDYKTNIKVKKIKLYKKNDIEIREKKYEILKEINTLEDVTLAQDIKIKNNILKTDEEDYLKVKKFYNEETKRYYFSYKNILDLENKFPQDKITFERRTKIINRILDNKKLTQNQSEYLKLKYNISQEDIKKAQEYREMLLNKNKKPKVKSKSKKLNILKYLNQHQKEIEKLTKEHEQDLLYGY